MHDGAALWSIKHAWQLAHRPRRTHERAHNDAMLHHIDSHTLWRHTHVFDFVLAAITSASGYLAAVMKIHGMNISARKHLGVCTEW